MTRLPELSVRALESANMVHLPAKNAVVSISALPLRAGVTPSRLTKIRRVCQHDVTGVGRDVTCRGRCRHAGWDRQSWALRVVIMARYPPPPAPAGPAAAGLQFVCQMGCRAIRRPLLQADAADWAGGLSRKC